VPETSEHPPLLDGASAAPSARDIRRATATSLVMVAALYALMGVLWRYYISRGVPLPLDGTWRYYTYGVAMVMGVAAVLALRHPVAAAVMALACFFAANVASLLEDPTSLVNGAMVKVLSFIILLRTMVLSLESRGRSGR
jgi:hypothetical protein